MAEVMELEVITPARRLFSEEVEALIIPGAEG
jgi:F0F1-type ATP synthase epsilon subunit